MFVWETVLAALGIYLLVVGRLSLVGRAVRGARARRMGLLLIAPLAIASLVALALSAVLPAGSASRTGHTAGMLTLFEMALVIAALAGASYLFFTGGPTQHVYWRGDPAPPREEDASPPAPPGRMTVSEAARALHISELEVLGLIRTGALSGTRSGPTFHIDRQAVDRLRLLRKER